MKLFIEREVTETKTGVPNVIILCYKLCFIGIVELYSLKKFKCLCVMNIFTYIGRVHDCNGCIKVVFLA